MTTDISMSRRSFVRTAAVGAAGTAVLAAAGAAFADEAADAADQANPTETEAAAGQPASSPVPGAVQDTTYGSYLNPQQDTEAFTTDYSALFSPLQIGSRTLANRIVKSSAGPCAGDAAQGVLSRRPSGRPGLGHASLFPTCRPFPGRPGPPCPITRSMSSWWVCTPSLA